jgi:predicted ATPase
MIKKVSFKNYKSFQELQEIEIKPITILIGKNSSGKSAITKLPTLIDVSLSGKIEEPLLYSNKDVELGAEFRDLIYGRQIGSLELTLESETDKFSVEVTSGVKDNDLPKIRRWILNDEINLIYDDSKKNYFDEVKQNEEKYIFNGFVLLNRDDLNLYKRNISLKSNYIGPFRETPKRSYNIISKIRNYEIGSKGQNAYQILIYDFIHNNGVLLDKVNEWYSVNFDGWKININTDSKPDYRVELVRENPLFTINLADVGQGISQSLPLIISSLIKRDEEVLTIIEQPELHLHPAAHGNLAELFANSTKETNNKFLIETHSNTFILRLRRLIAEQKLDKESVIIYSIEYDNENNRSFIKPIEIKDLGEVTYWPENVFTESLDESIAIRKAQLNSEKNEN